MPKNPSPRQQEASRSNGCKGRGPQAEASKQISAQNSRKSALFAKTNAMPHELAAWGDRSSLWHEHYQPQTPASLHLTNECARATLLADRCADYRDAVIEQQTANERNNWYQQQKRKVTGLRNELNGDRCESAVETFQTFGEGVRFMIQGFLELIEIIRNNGFLTTHEVGFAIKLFGVSPTRENIIRYVTPYVINMYNMGCTPGVSRL